MRLPSGRATRFRYKSQRPQEAHGVIASVFEPQFRLDVEDAKPFDFRLDHFPCGSGASISRLAFNADVTVQIDRIDAFMVQMPLTGRNDLHLGGARRNRLLLDRRLFSVIGPERTLRQRRSADCEMVLVRFGVGEMATSLAAHVGDAMRADEAGALEFAVEMPAGGVASSAWSRLTAYLLGELYKEGSLFYSPLAASQAGQLLMSTLLLHQPHTYSRLLQAPADQMSPRFMREAEEFLQRNADRPITADDLARFLHMSTRSVYAGFRRFLGTTPMQRLKEIRLGRAREDLLARQPGATVTSVAIAWGFTHLGNFANDYRERFGELPSQTLRVGRRPPRS